MYLNLRKVCAKLKQEHRIMPVLKSGKTNRMIRSLIFGLLDVFFMRLLHLNPLSEPTTWRDCLKKSLEVFIPVYLLNILMNSVTSLKCFFKSLPISDPPVINFLNFPWYKNILSLFQKNFKMTKRMSQWVLKINSSKPSNSERTVKTIFNYKCLDQSISALSKLPKYHPFTNSF